MNGLTPAHPDLKSGARMIRSTGVTDTSMIAGASEPDLALFRTASNISTTVLEVIRPIVIGGDTLIVTGIEDLMSVLCMVTALRPGITYAERGSVRILLTEPERPPSRVAKVARMTAERLRAYFMRPTGVYLSDPRDMLAANAREAVASGAIRIRILDHSQLTRDGRRTPAGARASVIVGEDFAALSSAGLSRRDLLDRAVMIDRVASEGPSYAARKNMAEVFWSAGHPCGMEVEKVLAAMLQPSDIEEALAAAVREVTGFALFQAGSGTANQIRSDLASQALARVYENGFAFVSVPAGVGLQEIQEDLASRLAVNAARMIGANNSEQWAVNVETATGAAWTDKRVSDVLAASAPLVLDGSIAAVEAESDLAATYRRLKCRPRAAGPGRAANSYEGFPEISCERLPLAPTKGQASAAVAVADELSASIEAAMDRSSERELLKLARIASQSLEAAFLVWRHGGMNARVRMVARGGPQSAQTEQNYLPMFGDVAMDEGEPQDLLGDALAVRALRSVDKARMALVAEIAQRKGQVLCLVEDGIARHALARKLAEVGDIAVTAVVSDKELRAQSVQGRDVTYQRAETPEVALSMIAGQASSASVILASAQQASEMALPEASVAVVLSVPDDKDRLAGALSAIDGLGKRTGRVSYLTFDDGLDCLSRKAGEVMVHPADLVAEAARQMRASGRDTRDGVSDIFSDLASRLPKGAAEDQAAGLRVAIVPSDEMFSIFVVRGICAEADQGAVPPRLLAISRDPETGREIVLRNQVGCAELLSAMELPDGTEDPRAAPVAPSAEHIDAIGRHLSHLTQWDARPERLVKLLETLAGFLGETEVEELFSDLCLVSLEIIAARWHDLLLESRRLAKAEGPGLNVAMDALNARPVWEIDDIRAEMLAMIDQRVVADVSRSKALHHRVVAIIHGTGRGKTSD